MSLSAPLDPTLEADGGRVMSTRLYSRPDTPQTHVTIERSYSTPTDIHGNLANIIWNSSDPNESILSMADVVFVALRRTPGVNVQKWDFDEVVKLGELGTLPRADSRSVHVRQCRVGDAGSRPGAFT